MVKAEPERDYYADLELQPSATPNDVKKQFKKLALQYHPDRNPSGDTTAKFQAIQSANEILTDPQQRAKYDAQRIRSGLLSTYSDAPPPPPRNNPSKSPGFSNFPPPPRPPPTTAKKTTFSPPPSGAQKYARFNMPDFTSWRTKDTDDAKSKTNDFKAWEHMRHGQGPIPRGRKESAKPPKPTSFQPARERHDQPGHNSNNTMPKRTTHRRTEWENLPDAGMPNLQRSNTTRTPPKPFTYGPATPGVDDPQARSAYFNISRERPAPSRSQTNMPPPPVRAPTAKKPDPLQSFKANLSNSDAFNGNGQRHHTQYPKAHGEKSNLSPGPGLHRSSTTATPRDSNSRTGFYDSDSLNVNGHHTRSASAHSPGRNARTAGVASVSTTSSDSSSDEEEAAQMKEAANLSKSAFNRPKQNPKSRLRPNMGAGAPQRSFFNPYVTADQAKDESMAPDQAYSAPRRHSEVEIPTHKRADEAPEGFMEHRKKHEASQSQQQASGVPTGSDSPHFMQRHKSFDEQYRRPSQEEDGRPSTANRDTPPMYDPGYTPFFFPQLGPPSGPLSDCPRATMSFDSSSSGKWSEHWPFGSLKNSKQVRPQIPPYWAVPSTVPAYENPHVRKKWSSHTPSPVEVTLEFTTGVNDGLLPTHADCDTTSSFRWPAGDTPKPFAGTPPLRSQSTENIDMRFSPSGNPPRFGASSGFFSKPTSDKAFDQPIEVPVRNGSANSQDSASRSQPEASSPEKTPFGPPPKGPACFYPNDWHQRAWAGTFQADPERLGSRVSSQRRAGTPRASSLNNAKRAVPNRNAGSQPGASDPMDEPPTYENATGDNLSSSRVSSEGSAMDIDPMDTPPSGNDNQQQTHNSEVSPTRANEPNKAWNQGPQLPPRIAVPVQPQTESLNFGLGDFNHVKPFGPGGDGLAGTDDLSSALPFESGASSTGPPTEKTAPSLKLPDPPKAPSAPKSLNPDSWKAYLAAMASYMLNWSNFNNTMLTHFHIRQESQKQMNPGWMSSQGDGDYNAYLESLVEDERARKRWEVACDLHKECINTLGQVRTAMKAETARIKNFQYPS